MEYREIHILIIITVCLWNLQGLARDVSLMVTWWIKQNSGDQQSALHTRYLLQEQHLMHTVL